MVRGTGREDMQHAIELLSVRITWCVKRKTIRGSAAVISRLEQPEAFSRTAEEEQQLVTDG